VGSFLLSLVEDEPPFEPFEEDPPSPPLEPEPLSEPEEPEESDPFEDVDPASESFLDEVPDEAFERLSVA
jgi:hypothetical protein